MLRRVIASLPFGSPASRTPATPRRYAVAALDEPGNSLDQSAAGGRCAETGRSSSELGSATDAELVVRLAEVELDRLSAYEQASSDVGVGEAGGRQFGDARLGLGEVLRRPRSKSEPSRLGSGAGRPDVGAEPVENQLRALECAVGQTLLSAPAVNLSLDHIRTAELERHLELFAQLN